MQSTDKLVVLDMETLNDSRRLGLQIWHPEFRVTSCAFYLPADDKKFFTTDFDEMKGTIAWLDQEGYTFIVYNAAFDSTILRHIFGVDEAFKRVIDCWRLVSYVDMRVDDKQSKKKTRDTSLPGAVKHFLGIDNFKLPYLNYFIERGMVKSRKPKQQQKEAHALVGSLPPELLEEYNMLDVMYTWELYKLCTAKLTEWDIDWTIDYKGYIHEASLYSESFIRGIRVDRGVLATSIETLQKEIADIDAELRKDTAVAKAEELINPPRSRVTPPMRKAHAKEHPDAWFLGSEPSEEEILEWARQKKWVRMNWGSSKHKIVLFCDVMECPIVKLTPGGKPEWSKKTIGTTGDFGKLLLKLLKKTKELEECMRIWKLSETDGRLHPMLRSSSTVSGRSTSSMA